MLRIASTWRILWLPRRASGAFAAVASETCPSLLKEKNRKATCDVHMTLLGLRLEGGLHYRISIVAPSRRYGFYVRASVRDVPMR